MLLQARVHFVNGMICQGERQNQHQCRAKTSRGQNLYANAAIFTLLEVKEVPKIPITFKMHLFLRIRQNDSRRNTEIMKSSIETNDC
jgi:hypothetical protein